MNLSLMAKSYYFFITFHVQIQAVYLEVSHQIYWVLKSVDDFNYKHYGIWFHLYCLQWKKHSSIRGKALQQHLPYFITTWPVLKCHLCNKAFPDPSSFCPIALLCFSSEHVILSDINSGNRIKNAKENWSIGGKALGLFFFSTPPPLFSF